MLSTKIIELYDVGGELADDNGKAACNFLGKGA
jgi:hypothetical protein